MQRKATIIGNKVERSAITTKERIIDPTGFLTRSSRGLDAEEQKAFSEWKRKCQNGEIEINYP